MAVAEVERLPADVGFEQVFDAHVRAGRPCVLERAASAWSACTRWTPSFFVERYGDVEVDFVDTRTHVREPRPLREYFGLDAATAPRYYVCDWDFRKRQRELLDDVGEVPVFDVDWIDGIPKFARPDLMWIYIGHGGTRGPTHADNYGSSAWLAVIRGRKRVRFMAPQKHLRAVEVDLFAAESADVAEATLGPGDVLYVPSGVWHAAYNDEYCVSVTANFIDGASFVEYRAFAAQRWYGRRMLIRQLNGLEGLPSGPARERELAHLALALERYRAALEADLNEIALFCEVLAEHQQ